MIATPKVDHVIVTHSSDTENREVDARVRLRVEVLDALMNVKGIRSVAAQARELGVSRSNLFRLRTGDIEPRLELAMKMARLAGTTVEALFDLRAGDDRD
jgi:DNA-binding XRE family transcriptional regulator